MINEKIQNLLKELQIECDKEDVTALCTLHKQGDAAQMLVGDLHEITALLMIQDNELDDNLPIPANVLRSIGQHALSKTTEEIVPDHTFVVDDINDIHEIIDRITRGEFE